MCRIGLGGEGGGCSHKYRILNSLSLHLLGRLRPFAILTTVGTYLVILLLQHGVPRHDHFNASLKTTNVKMEGSCFTCGQARVLGEPQIASDLGPGGPHITSDLGPGGPISRRYIRIICNT